MLSTFTDSEMLHAHIWGMEHAARRAREKSKELGRTVDTFFNIMDLAGGGAAHWKVLEYAKPMTFVDQNYYPERLGAFYIINAPWMFPVVWKVVKSWLDPRTQSKVSIYPCVFVIFRFIF